MTVRVKICGIRTMESAVVAADAGADFLGFIFVAASKRLIDPTHALPIINAVRDRAQIVGVFQNNDIAYVNDFVEKLKLDMVQLHGNESAAYIQQMHVPVIKTITSPKDAHTVRVAYLLFDRKTQGMGARVDATDAKTVAATCPLFFAGGLTPENVEQIIADVHPFGVDVAGGIETNGIPDTNKIQAFIRAAKGALL